MPKPSKNAREYKKLRGNIQAEKDVLSWYRSVAKGGGEERVSNWGRKHFQLGKIYNFNYNPKTKSMLSFYDRNPLVLSLGQLRRKGQDGTLDFGVNLHFVPLKMRGKILDAVYDFNKTAIEREISSKQRTTAGEQQPLTKVDYKNFQKFLSGYGFEFAFRSYYPQRRSNVYVLPYGDWFKTLYLNHEDVVGASIQMIYQAYRDEKSGSSIRNAFSRMSSAARRFFTS